MHANEELLERFYAAFARLDAAGMAACYAPDAHFSDPAFPDLRGPEVPAMWAMLTSRSTGLRIETSGITADDRKGEAHWVAHYAFGPDQRPVVNRVRSTFEFNGGLIVRQHDQFDFHAWSAQALGLKGRLLGWTPIVQSAAQRQAAAGLQDFMARQA
jgi:ketosteroid isomerase-like protein